MILPIYDTTSSSKTGNNTGNTLTWSHTCSAGSNSSGILVVGVGTRNGKSVSSITYGGDALTKIRHDQPGVDTRTELWYKLLPKSGANNIVVTISANDYIRAGAVSYEQVSGVGTSGGTGVTTDTQSFSQIEITGNTRFNVIVDVINLQGNQDDLISLQQDRWDQRDTAEGRSAGSTAVGSSSTFNIGWDWTGNKAFSESYVLLVPPQTVGPFPTFFN